MLLDAQETFSAAQAVTGPGDTPSTNSLDTGPGIGGIGEPVYWFVKTNAGVTSGGAATVQAVLQDSTDNVTWADCGAGAVQPLASLGANKVVTAMRLPISARRYIRVVYRVGTAALTAGTFSAYMVKDIDAQQFMPTVFTVV